MITLPYGIADFRRIRREGMAYVDRTAYIPRIERLGSTLVFLRPRRFGKSLWLQTLANYYDVRRAEEFTDLFGGLAIGRTPTPRANRSFILQWNFSVVDPSGSIGQIAESLREHVSSRAKNFIADYKDRLPVKVETEGSATAILDSLLSAVRRTPHPLYLLIDEYDNFINEVMARDVETYRALVHTDGPFKLLFKAVKNATEGQGLERVFITGVSPVALNDLTSGFNIARNVSLEPDLAGLCGFEESEIRGLLDQISQERDLSPEALEDAVATMRTWYNGYRFTASEGRGLVYNPTNVLYFLDHLHRHVEDVQQLLVPGVGVHVEHQRARGVADVGGVHRAAGQLPHQPGVHRAEGQLAGLRRGARAGHGVEDPLQLGAGEVGVDDQAGLAPEALFQAALAQGCAGGLGAAVLPDDGVVHGLAGAAVPHHRGLALVGDADRGDLACRRAGLGERPTAAPLPEMRQAAALMAWTAHLEQDPVAGLQMQIPGIQFFDLPAITDLHLGQPDRLGIGLYHLVDCELIHVRHDTRVRAEGKRDRRPTP